MNPRFIVGVAALLTVVAGCGGDGTSSSSDPSTAPVDAAVTTSTAPVVAASPSGSEPTDSSPTSPPETSAPTTVATTVASTVRTGSGEGDADCLNGLWFAGSAELQRRIDSYGIPLELLVEPTSSSTMTLADGMFVADTVISLTGMLPIGDGVQLTGSGTSHVEGTYTTDGGVITTLRTVETSEIGDWVAVADGQTIPLPAAASLGDPPSADADFSGSTFTCSDTTLTFQVTGSPFGEITFVREA